MSADLLGTGAWARDVVLVDGTTACIRTVKAEDGPSLARPCTGACQPKQCACATWAPTPGSRRRK